METKLSQKRVLITGGTGSFGSKFVQRLLRTNVEEIVVFSRDEWKQDWLRKQHKDSRLRFIIGDIRSRSSTAQALKGIDYVFHASALKQVPSCELFPSEAVHTNILGSSNLISAARDLGVKGVVALSTDKAVFPVNAMGMTKALMEKEVYAASRERAVDDPIFSVTRYGNVMYSRGSVIPYFRQQIMAGKEVAVTNPNMTRFMMSLEDSLDLVLYAMEHAKPGDLFVKKAPAATVGDLLNALETILGKKARMVNIGARLGEKVHETLLSAEEIARSDDGGAYFRVPLDTESTDYGPYVSEGLSLDSAPRGYSSDSTRQLRGQELIDLLLSLPEFIKESE